MGGGGGGTRERDGLGGVMRERGREMQEEGQEEGKRKRVEEVREREGGSPWRDSGRERMEKEGA